MFQILIYRILYDIARYFICLKNFKVRMKEDDSAAKNESNILLWVAKSLVATLNLTLLRT